jgi:signal transduction histidine kinase
MPQRYVWKLVAPTFFLGAILLGVGVLAAWNVQTQQQTNSELIAREVRGMIAIEELNLEMREIRYQINLFLRTSDLTHLRNVAKVHPKADQLLKKAGFSARTPEEIELLEVASQGYERFFATFDESSRAIGIVYGMDPSNPPENSPSSPALSLSDADRESLIQQSERWADLLTTDVLEPLEKCFDVNKDVVERTNNASEGTARHLTIGFLLLGLCGGIAGILWGVGMGRTIGRSIVQLNVSVRGATSKLSDLRGAVTVTHRGDLVGLEDGIKALEQNVSSAVEQLQQKERELLRSEQLARVGQLAAGLAHELRNPLMPMKMLVQAAIERGSEAGLKGRSLEILNQEISRLEHSIQAFLDFARPPAPKKQTYDLGEIVRATSFLVGVRCKQQSIELQVHVPETPVVVSVDQAQMKQLLLNLLLNAMDAVKQDGFIRVDLIASTHLPEEIDPYSKVTDHHRPSMDIECTNLRHPAVFPEHDPVSYALLRVTDNGEGISEEIIDRIFEPFVTSKETGTGLGLSICRRIAEMHRGLLVASNRVGGGAQFSLFLPMEPSHSAAPPENRSRNRSEGIHSNSNSS